MNPSWAKNPSALLVTFSKIGSKIGIFYFFHCIFRKYQFVTQTENQSFLEEKFFANQKTEIRVNKVPILVNKKQEKIIQL